MFVSSINDVSLLATRVPKRTVLVITDSKTGFGLVMTCPSSVALMLLVVCARRSASCNVSDGVQLALLMDKLIPCFVCVKLIVQSE